MDINTGHIVKSASVSHTDTSQIRDNTSVNNRVQPNVVQNPNVSNASTLLKSLLPGDVLTGLITQMKDSQVLINLNDGSFLSAHLAGNSNVSNGDIVTFLVKNISDNQLSLKVMPANEQENMFISKALEAAGLFPTEENTAMIKELLSLNMPVNSDMLNNMNRLMGQYPNSDIKTIANLVRLDMPVTSENIGMFEAYKHFDARLDGQLSSLTDSLFNTINEAAANKDSSALDDINSLINGFYGSGDEAVESTPLKNAFSSDFINDLSQQLSNISDAGKELANSLNDDSATLKNLLLSIINNNNLSDPSAKLTNSPAFKQLLNQFITETMRLTPKDVGASDNTINSYYKRVRKNLEDVANVFKSEAVNNNLDKDMQNIKSNIDFMNDLNKNMTFFQMPLKFSEGEGNGELYVFTNKKALANKADNVSAMLHLDMDNLGPVDVYVKLDKMRVSTNFILESEEMLDFLYSHIDELNSRLEQLGYSTHFEMKVADKEKDNFDFVDNFVERDIHPENNGQFVFDIKA